MNIIRNQLQFVLKNCDKSYGFIYYRKNLRENTGFVWFSLLWMWKFCNIVYVKCLLYITNFPEKINASRVT